MFGIKVATSSILRRSLRSINVGPDLSKMVKSDKVVIFMKGTPDSPMCGFSNKVCQIMDVHGVSFTAHNVLESDDVREGIKKFSNWPTIPQVYINGEFIGGCDIMLQLHNSGALVEELEKGGISSKFSTTESK